MRADELNGVVKRVIRYTITHPYERDCWEKAPAITGVLASEDSDSIAAVGRWIDRAVDTQTSEGHLSYSDRLELSVGHVATFTPTAPLSSSLGYPLLAFYERTKEPRYLTAAQRQADALLRTPRTSDGGFWARKEGPELWIDFIYMMCPFLARLGRITGSAKYIDEAFTQFDVHVKHLVDPYKHLARHAWREVPDSYPQSTLWARGNGWLIATVVDLLDLVPEHPRAKAASEVGQRALAAMRSRQDSSGYLRHILDDPDSKVEASASLMYAYAVGRGVRQKVVDADYIPSALRAFEVVAGSVDEDGAVPGVAVPPGGPGVPFGTTLFGQGFFLQAAAVLREHLVAAPQRR
jgi:unsaturated rhamnogalacturonyl hydrolase